MSNGEYGGAAIALAVVLVFFGVRAFWLWYFRISRMVELLESIDLTLKHAPWQEKHQLTSAQLSRAAQIPSRVPAYK